MPLARAALHPVLKPGQVEMRPACPHLPFRCCLSKPFPAHGGGETIRLNHMAFLHQLPQRQSPMSCLWCPPQHQAGTKQLDASPCHDSCLLGSIQVSPHPRSTPGQQTTLLCKTLYQQTLDRCRAVPVPAAQDSSSPCLDSAERKKSLVKQNYEALCHMGPAAGFLEARKWEPILHQKVTFKRTLRLLMHLCTPLHPPLLPGATGVICSCASCTNGGRRLGLNPWVLDPHLKPWAGCHCCQCPLGKSEDLL